MISIVIPVLNEAKEIETRLKSFQKLRQNGNEIILVDGGSLDDTFHLAQVYVDKSLISSKGRARQMNAGAKVAAGDYLLFLHLDSHLSTQALIDIAGTNSLPSWGFFRIKLSGEDKVFRLIERMMSLRSKFTSIATGDQGLFISKQLFDEINGYPDIELMEDIAICNILRKKKKPVMLTNIITTSSRRWEKQGVIKTILFMWWLRLLYFAGVSPDYLNKYYYPEDNG